MSSSTTSAVLSAILQLIIVFISITALVQTKNRYLDTAFKERAGEICEEIAFVATLGKWGMVETNPFPETIASSPYRIYIGRGIVTVSGRGNVSCEIPWLFGNSSVSGGSSLAVYWKGNGSFVGRIK